jgi:hypothetical protein
VVTAVRRLAPRPDAECPPPRTQPHDRTAASIPARWQWNVTRDDHPCDRSLLVGLARGRPTLPTARGHDYTEEQSRDGQCPQQPEGFPANSRCTDTLPPQAPASHGAPVTRVTQNAYLHRLGPGIQIRSLTLARPSIRTRQPRTLSSSRHLPRRAIEPPSSTTGIRRYASSSGSGLGCLLVIRWTTNPTGSPWRPAPRQRADTSTTPRRLPEITCAPVQAASDAR